MTENGKGLVDIGRLVLRFANVNRATRHENGVTHESDTDHTVMLSVCACALAEKLYADLDRGLVAQFAIVHDLVEAYAEDTDSFGITEDVKLEKEKREREAMLRIRKEFESLYEWIPTMIESYERLDTREARFVKVLDKIMPKITHILNEGIVFKERNESYEAMVDHFNTQRALLAREYAPDMPELISIFDELSNEVLKNRLER